MPCARLSARADTGATSPWTDARGLAGVANVGPEAFAYIGGQAYGEAAGFATVVAKVVAQHLGCWNGEDFKRLAQQVKETRVAVYLAHQVQRGP